MNNDHDQHIERPTHRSGRFLYAGLLLAALLVALSACGGGSPSPASSQTPNQASAGANGDASPPPGVQTFGTLSREHTDGPVNYPQTPPVGGAHSPVWQNCGFYDKPIANEHGVHSMEHGAVWITYQPNLPADQVAILKQIAQQPYILVSPYPKSAGTGGGLRLEHPAQARLGD